MTPTQLGHRAAAQGDAETTCPYVDGTVVRDMLGYVQWLNAYEQVARYCAGGGLDPRGHAPINPHLCIRDSRKVCNCCGSCSVECREEGREGVLHTLKGLGKKALTKLVERLEGVATKASPSAWLPPGQHPRGVCSSMCGDNQVTWFHSDTHEWSNWCTPYCRNRAKAATPAKRWDRP